MHSQRVLDLVIRGFIALVVGAGAITLAVSPIFSPRPDPTSLLVFCAAAAAAEWIKVAAIDDSPVAVSLSLAVIVAAMTTFGPVGATATGLSAVLIPGLFRRPRPETRKLVFNMGLFTLCAGAAALTYGSIGGRPGGRIGPLDLVAALSGAFVYLAINWTLLAIVIHLTTGREFRAIWFDDLRWLPAQVVAAAALGFALGASYRLLGWMGAAIYVMPLVAMRESLRLYTSRVSQANRELVAANGALDATNTGLVKTLAAVIDARDVFLYGHSLQASQYATEVARRLGLSAAEVRVTELGALLHDIGKIGIAESILNKPARLTDEEFEEIKAHCRIGYDLLSNLPGFEDVAEVVYSHHERFDGKGYPRQLSGTNIPVGARIVSVVESVEAMISDRPYRKGMTPDEVLEELARGAGTQWDAEVASIFAGMLSTDRKHLVMHNSALEVALNRAPLGELLADPDRPVDPSLNNLTATFQTAAQPIFVLDADHQVVSLNPVAERLIGRASTDVEGESWSDLCVSHESYREIPRSFFGATRQVSMYAAGGQRAELEVTGTPLRTSSATYWLVLGHDVTERVRRESELERRAHTDHLTRLATRAAFEERIAAAMHEGTRPLTLVLLDLDGLKRINDTLGHPAGDQALMLLGGALAAEMRSVDLAARFGGDEFVVMLAGATMESARLVTERVSSRLALAASGLDLDLSFCAGVATWDGTTDLAGLIAAADGDLYSHKHARNDDVIVQLHAPGRSA